MSDWLSGPRLIDGVIAFTLLEAWFLFAYHRRTGRGVAPRDFVANMASGMSLMLALRCAVAAASALWVALFVLLAGVLHATDLWRRWNGSGA